MKSSIIKSVEIFTDGTLNFFYSPLKSTRQVIFHEKDANNSLFFRKLTKNQLLQNVSHTSYKSRYKF